jgi:hypothetical protein
VGVTTVVTRSNYRHLDEIVALAHALGATAFHLSVVRSVGSAALKPSLSPPFALLRPHWRKALETAATLGLACLAGRSGGADTLKERFAGLGVVAAAERLQTERALA